MRRWLLALPASLTILRGGGGPDKRAFAERLDAAQRGDGRVFGELFTEFAPRIRGFLRARGVEDPDGSTNEVFLRVFRSIDTFRGSESAFVGWLFQIARNLATDEARARQRRVSTVHTEDDRLAELKSTDAVNDWFGEQAAGDEARDLLRHLSDQQAEILLLRAVAGLSFDEIAKAVGKRPSAVRASYSRGRAALREIIEAAEREGETPSS